MGKNAIELRDVSVRYRTQKVRSLKEFVVSSLTGRANAHYFYSLRDVNVAIAPGETVGIIGHNGAGKSTMLRVAAGIITPSTGCTIRRGTMAPLIELGTGFEAELSGRENIFFNGALLGRSRAHMLRHVDEIISFAGLEEFIDSPLRTYSTGMVARLAFSIATAVDADTILLDEILSVGDASFRDRSQQRIRSFAGSGATVVLVSHDMTSVKSLCRRVILVDHGQVVADGAPEEVIARYGGGTAA